MTIGKYLIRSLFSIMLTVYPIWCYGYEFDFIPYQGAVKEMVTDHFIILYPESYQKVAEKTAVYAEDIHQKLAPFMKWHPIEKTTLILTDHTDYPNGMSLPFIRNMIYLYLAPADLEKILANAENPFYTLILHEYTHTLHLDQIRGAALFWRIFYGKTYFPLTGSFRWYMEGTAVLAESKLAPGGRLASHYNHAVIRTAALQNRIPSLHELVLPVMDWPNGDAVYQYGACFMNYLYTQYGKEKLDSFILDISDDFWPFILLFVMKFEKIYGKPLAVLWDEWRAYEKQKAAEYPALKAADNQLTHLKGRIADIIQTKEGLLIAAESYADDYALYLLNNNNNLKKIHIGRHRSVSSTADQRYLLYTRSADYAGGFEYFDLYYLDLKTGIEKRLTNRKRVNYASFATDSPRGVFVSHSGLGSTLYSAEFSNGKLSSPETIPLLPEISFIDAPSINPRGDKVVFSARLTNGQINLYLLDLTGQKLEVLDEDIKAKKARWIDDETISFVAAGELTDELYSLTLSDRRLVKRITTTGSVLDGLISGDTAYYVDYTPAGEEVFQSTIRNADAGTLIQSITPGIFQPDNLTIPNNDTRYYNGIRYILPTAWAFLPYQLSSFAVYSINGSYFKIPIFAPQLMIYNSLPLGRFSYTLTVGLDYLKLYPDNSFSFRFKLPYINLAYSWQNTTGGSKHFINNITYERRYNNHFPIIFSNALGVNYNFSLEGYGNLYWGVSVDHIFKEYDFTLKKLTNTFSFNEILIYYYIQSRFQSSRWDRGIYLSLAALQTPHYILDNVPLYVLRGLIRGRVPFYNTFFFLDIEGGIELTGQNYFNASSEMIRISGSILSNDSPGSASATIDMKAFPIEKTYAIAQGSTFVSTDLGFDITCIKKSLYSYFATFGFKEFYLRTYGEFAFLYNPADILLRGILFDGVVELGLNLFVAYGNIDVSLLLGGAVGYRILDQWPSWSVFFYANFGL